MAEDPMIDFFNGAVREQAGLSPGLGETWATHFGAGTAKEQKDMLKGITDQTQPSSSGGGGGEVSYRNFIIIIAVSTAPWTIFYAVDQINSAYTMVKRQLTEIATDITYYDYADPAVKYIKGVPAREANVSGLYYRFTTGGDHPKIIVRGEVLEHETVTVIGCSRVHTTIHSDVGYCQIKRKSALDTPFWSWGSAGILPLFKDTNGPKIEFKDGNPSYAFIEDDHSVVKWADVQKIDFDRLPPHRFVAAEFENVDLPNPDRNSLQYIKGMSVREARVSGRFFAYESGKKYPVLRYNDHGEQLKNEYVQVAGCARRSGGYCQITRALAFDKTTATGEHFKQLERVEGFINLNETIQFKDGKSFEFIEDQPPAPTRPDALKTEGNKASSTNNNRPSSGP
jgi:hypothetical protein